MNVNIILLSTLSLLSECPDIGTGYSQQSNTPIFSVQDDIVSGEAGIDGLIIPGSIRARGLIGLVSVAGTLSFQDGMLIWTVRDTRECGAYTLLEDDDGRRIFVAEYTIENDEHIRWSGVLLENGVEDVTALWTRVDGDFVHDLFLPDRVTLNFTPVES